MSLPVEPQGQKHCSQCAPALRHQRAEIEFLLKEEGESWFRHLAVWLFGKGKLLPYSFSISSQVELEEFLLHLLRQWLHF